MPFKKVKRKKVKRKKVIRKQVKRKKVKRKKVKRKKVKRKTKFGKSKPKSFDVRSFAKRNKVPLSVAATMLASVGVGAGYYYKTRSSKSSKMTGTEERQYSKGEIKKKLTDPIGAVIQENQKLKKMLYKVSIKHEECRKTIYNWRQGDTMGYYTSQYDEALKDTDLKDKVLENELEKIHHEMKTNMTGKYLRKNFGKRKRKRKFGSTSDKDVYGNTKRDVPLSLHTNAASSVPYLALMYGSTWTSIPQEVRDFIWNIASEVASIKKLDKSWKEVTDAMVKILYDSHYTTKKIPLPSHRTYAQNMNLLINFILSGKSKTPTNISTRDFQNNVQKISQFLTASLGKTDKRSLTTDDIQSIFCAGINIKVNEKAKKQAEKMLDNSF
jgi:hypothetical protein